MKKSDILKKAQYLFQCNEFHEFICLWMAFNSYYNLKGTGSELSRIIHSLDDSKTLEKWNDIKNDERIFKEFENTRNECRNSVYNKRRDRYVSFNKSESNAIKDFLEVVYTIRCNLFHGDKKSLKTDILLVQWANKWLRKVLT